MSRNSVGATRVALVVVALVGGGIATAEAGVALQKLKCPAGQVPVSDGSGWICGDVDGPGHELIFLTSRSFTGDLGGGAGADRICQGLADAAGLRGTFKAWLSDSRLSPATAFTKAAVPYLHTDGALVANDWADLTTYSAAQCLVNPITVDETGATLANTTVWTATDDDGSSSPVHCQDWTGRSPGLLAAREVAADEARRARDDQGWEVRHRWRGRAAGLRRRPAGVTFSSAGRP